MSDIGIWTCPMCGHEAIEPIVHAGCPWTHEQDEQDRYVDEMMTSAKGTLARLCSLARLRSLGDGDDIAFINAAESVIADALDGIDPEVGAAIDRSVHDFITTD